MVGIGEGGNRHPKDKKTHIILPHNNNIVLRNPNTALRLHIRHRRIPHDLPKHITHRTPFTHKYAIPEHGRRTRAAARVIMYIAHRKHRDKTQQVRSTRKDLNNTRATKAVQDEILQILDARREFFVKGFQTAAVGVTGFDQILAGIEVLASFGIFDVALLCEFAEEDFGDGAAEDDGGWVFDLFCDFGNVFVGVWVVDFVEGDDGGEFFVSEGFDYFFDGFRGPVLEWLFEGEAVERAGYGLRRRAVAGKLVLEGFDGCRFHCGMSSLYGSPW